MPYAAITYPVKPGHEDAIAEIFAGFQRVSSPVLRNEAGDAVGKLLGTAVFIKDDVMIRVIHYEGDFASVSRTMSGHSGVHRLEEQLAPYLTERRETSTTEGFQSYFSASTMRCISQLSVDTLPASG